VEDEEKSSSKKRIESQANTEKGVACYASVINYGKYAISKFNGGAVWAGIPCQKTQVRWEKTDCDKWPRQEQG
jgi:hypothetical protein